MSKKLFFFTAFIISTLFYPKITHASSNPSQVAKIKIVSLDYSCYRNQSDSKIPVFIEKRKPVVDLLPKIDRCFVGVKNYSDPVFTITYKYLSSTISKKITTNVSRALWLSVSSGCYSAVIEGNLKNPDQVFHLKSISCH